MVPAAAAAAAAAGGCGPPSAGIMWEGVVTRCRCTPGCCAASRRLTDLRGQAARVAGGQAEAGVSRRPPAAASLAWL